jgi:hypothetical protein
VLGDVDHRWRRRRWLISLAVFLLLPFTLAACGVSPPRPPAATRTVTLTASYQGVTADQLARGRWSLLPSAPIPDRDYPVGVWTGQQLLVWGGQSGPHDLVLHNDGAAYDPARRLWRQLPPAPLTPRALAAAAWSGRELIVWGGYDHLAMDPSGVHVAGDGAAYDPVRQTWRRLPPAPLSARAGATAVWTGREVLVVGGGPAPRTDHDRPFTDGPPTTRPVTAGGVWPQAPSCEAPWSISTWCGQARGCWYGATGSRWTARPSPWLGGSTPSAR